MDTITTRVWIGLIGLTPRAESSILENSKGAYTNIITMASSIAEYEGKVKELLNHYLFDLIEIIDAEPYEERILRNPIDHELIELAADVMKHGGTRFGTLHTF